MFLAQKRLEALLDQPTTLERATLARSKALSMLLERKTRKDLLIQENVCEVSSLVNYFETDVFTASRPDCAFCRDLRTHDTKGMRDS
jgi:hypothetical protein